MKPDSVSKTTITGKWLPGINPDSSAIGNMIAMARRVGQENMCVVALASACSH
jgi:hypothetical protein